MVSIKGHFDGRAVVLDEPATLAVGQAVRVVVGEADPVAAAPSPQPRPPLGGFAAGLLEASFTPFADLTATLMNGDAWDESAALHTDPLDAVPSDFVRRPGSAAGQIGIADDFDATPEEFEAYL